jgi:hypothetical protein
MDGFHSHKRAGLRCSMTVELVSQLSRNLFRSKLNPDCRDTNRALPPEAQTTLAGLRAEPVFCRAEESA